MHSKFERLCQKFKLTPNYQNSDQLQKLSKWCKLKISSDIEYQGTPEQRYNKYYALATDYLVKFKENLPKSIEQKVPAYNNLSPIQYAVLHGYDKFISEQADISSSVLDQADVNGMTLLHESAIKGYASTVKALLDKGADPNRYNKQHQLPIHSALIVPMIHNDDLIKHKEAIFRDLIKYSPKLLADKGDDASMLMHLIAAAEFYTLLAEVLQIDSNLAFLQNTASIYPIHTALLNYQLPNIKLLLENTKVATLVDGHKLIPLHYAARYGNKDITEACCHATSNLNIRDGEAKTPLLLAAAVGNQDALEVLIKKGADLMLVDYTGFSILHYAVTKENEAMVHWLVDNVPATLLNMKDKENHTPLYYAKRNNQAIADILLSKGAIDETNSNQATI